MQVCTVDSLVDIFHQKVGVPLNTPNIARATWEELGVESLAQAEVLATIGNTMGIHLEFEQILQTRNITEFANVVQAAMIESSAR